MHRNKMLRNRKENRKTALVYNENPDVLSVPEYQIGRAKRKEKCGMNDLTGQRFGHLTAKTHWKEPLDLSL